MRGFAIILGSAAMLIAGSAQAGVSGLYGTGVDVAGGVDQAWTIVSSTGVPAPGGTAYPFTGAGFPYPYWLTPSSGAWDSPDSGNTTVNSGRDPTLAGDYAWQTTFSSNGAGAIRLEFAADNAVSSIVLNGATVWTSSHCVTDTSCPSDYGQLQSIILSGFSSGLNTLDFNVVNYAQNGGNPTGLYVEAVPEASTWAMMLIGFAGLGLAGYRRTKDGRAALIA
jgi:hypothetical protein